MIIFGLTLAAALPLVVGFLLVSYMCRYEKKWSVLERACLGFGAGAGLLTFEMFLMAWLGIEFRLSTLFFLQAGEIVLLLYLLRGSAPPPVGMHEGQYKFRPAIKILFAILSGWILLKLLFVGYESSIWPVYTWDSIENWSAGAKFFYYRKGLVLNSSDEHFLGSGYRTFLSYPLHVLLLQVWFSLGMSEVNESLIKFWNVFYYGSTLGLLYSAVKREGSPVIALLAAFFLSTAPLLTYHAIEAYADLPLGYYGLAAAACFWKALKAADNEKEGPIFLTGIFSALAIWTKLEGVFFGIAFGVGILFYLIGRRPPLGIAIRHFVAFAAPICILYLPWATFLAQRNIVFGRGEQFLAHGLHLEVFQVIWQQIIFSVNFNLIFPFFFFIALVGLRRIIRSDLKYLFMVLLLVVASYLFVYVTTENYKWVVLLTALDRNILTCIPMIYYLSALTVSALLMKEPSRTP